MFAEAIDLGSSLQGLSFKQFAPDTVDAQIRHAIRTCWIILPQERKTVEVLKMEVRRIMDRALASFEEDFRSFGVPEDRSNPVADILKSASSLP